MNFKKLFIILIIIICCLFIITYFNLNGNSLKFEKPEGYSIKDTTDNVTLLTNNKTRIKFNENPYDKKLHISPSSYSKKYPEFNVTNSTEVYNGITVKIISLYNGSDVQHHYWYNKNKHTYHIYMHGDDQSAVKSIIESTK